QQVPLPLPERQRDLLLSLSPRAGEELPLSLPPLGEKALPSGLPLPARGEGGGEGYSGAACRPFSAHCQRLRSASGVRLSVPLARKHLAQRSALLLASPDRPRRI